MNEKSPEPNRSANSYVLQALMGSEETRRGFTLRPVSPTLQATIAEAEKALGLPPITKKEKEEHLENIEIAKSELVKSFKPAALATLAACLASRNPALSFEELIHDAELLLLATEKAPWMRSLRANIARSSLLSQGLEVVENAPSNLTTILRDELKLTGQKSQQSFLRFVLDPKTNPEIAEDEFPIPLDQELLDSMLNAPPPDDLLFDIENLRRLRNLQKKTNSAKHKPPKPRRKAATATSEV